MAERSRTLHAFAFGMMFFVCGWMVGSGGIGPLLRDSPTISTLIMVHVFMFSLAVWMATSKAPTGGASDEPVGTDRPGEGP